MIGYAPFLGQVRLASPGFFRMGQRSVPIRQWSELMSRLSSRPDCVAEIDRLFGRGALPDLDEKIGFAAGFAAGAGVELEPSRVDLTEQEVRILDTAEACLRLSAPSVPPSSAGMPTWAWVVGGLAAAGVVAYVATRKK